MSNPGFKDQFGVECRQIPVRKKDSLLATCLSIKEGTRLLSNIDKKDQTWVLFAALCYTQLVVLPPINPKANLANVDAEEEDQDVDGMAPAATQIVDVLQAMVVQDHWLLDDTALIGKVSPPIFRVLTSMQLLICPPKTR